MAQLNKLFFMANLTRDPELRYTPSGVAVTTLRIAINNTYKNKAGEKVQEVCFITAVAWDRQAELCNQYLKKGSPFFGEGRLVNREWEKDGKKTSVIEIRLDRVQFLGQAAEEAGKDGMDHE